MADDACSAPARKRKPTIQMSCIDCNQSVERRSQSQIRCRECSKIIARERSRIRNNKGVVGNTITCARCEEPVVASGSRQKYCPDCYKITRREKKRKEESSNTCATCKSEFMAQRSDAKYCSTDCKNVARRKGGKVVECKACGEKFKKRGGTNLWCKPCAQERAAKAKRLERVENSVKYRAYNAKYREENQEKLKISRKEYKERKSEDPYWLLNSRISRSINGAIKSMKAGRRWEALVGYTVNDLHAHLEKQFRRGMTWDNMGEWHIDHIRPISSFDFSIDIDDTVRECWALSNLQPLWAFDNMSKGSKILHLV